MILEWYLGQSVTNLHKIYWVSTRYKAFDKYPHSNAMTPHLQTKKAKLRKVKGEFGARERWLLSQNRNRACRVCSPGSLHFTFAWKLTLVTQPVSPSPHRSMNMSLLWGKVPPGQRIWPAAPGVTVQDFCVTSHPLTDVS